MSLIARVALISFFKLVFKMNNLNNWIKKSLSVKKIGNYDLGHKMHVNVRDFRVIHLVQDIIKLQYP